MKKNIIILLLISFMLIGCSHKNGKARIDTYLESNCNSYEIFESYKFGGGENESSGEVYYVKCNGKDAVYRESHEGLIQKRNSTETLSYVDIQQSEHEIYTFHNNELYMLVEDDINNYLAEIEKIYRQNNMNGIHVFSVTDNFNEAHGKFMLISSMSARSGCRFHYNARLLIDPSLYSFDNLSDLLRDNIEKYDGEIKCW